MNIFLFQEQKERKQKIEQQCEKFKPQLYYQNVPLIDPDWGFPYIIYIPQYNLLFCGIPKAGTSTWVQGIDQK